MVAKDRRLTKRADFQRLSKRGRTWTSRLLILKAMPNSLPVSRCGFSVSKAIGNAVSRNCVKRRLREIARQRHLKPGWDVLIIARPPVAGAKFGEIEKAMVQLVGQARLLGTEDERASTRTD